MIFLKLKSTPRAWSIIVRKVTKNQRKRKKNKKTITFSVFAYLTGGKDRRLRSFSRTRLILILQ